MPNRRQEGSRFRKRNPTDQAELFLYFNAVYTVENALSKVKDEKGMKRVEKFLKEDICPECGGSRLSDAARAPRLRGIGLAQACQMPLKELVDWVAGVPDSLLKDFCAYVTDHTPCGRHIIAANEGAAVGIERK